tara:strand:- start:76 stop:318 length:243 start_codon:yes stop_codon:yes gene_type:complete
MTTYKTIRKNASKKIEALIELSTKITSWGRAYEKESKVSELNSFLSNNYKDLTIESQYEDGVLSKVFFKGRRNTFTLHFS